MSSQFVYDRQPWGIAGEDRRESIHGGLTAAFMLLTSSLAM